jgi:hypothetical protein
VAFIAAFEGNRIQNSYMYFHCEVASRSSILLISGDGKCYVQSV